MSVKPGWYPDPAEPTTQRYWDGEGWIGEPLPVDATPPPGPPALGPAPLAPAPVGESALPAPGLATATPGPSAGAPPSGTGYPAGTGHPGEPAAGYPPAWPPTSAPPRTNGSPPPPGPGYPPQQPGTGYPPVPPATASAPPGWPYPPYPYAVPAPRPHGFALAQFGPRLVARLIDIGLVFLLNVVVNGWFVWHWVEQILPTFREAMNRAMAGETSTEGLPQIGAQADALELTILLIAAALWFAYEVPALANSGQTVGKRLMGIRVVPLTEDQPLGFGRAFRRWSTLGLLPTFLWYCCGIGFLLQLIDCVSALYDRPLRQAMHDKRAQTVVVRVPPTPTDRRREIPDEHTDAPGGSA